MKPVSSFELSMTGEDSKLSSNPITWWPSEACTKFCDLTILLTDDGSPWVDGTSFLMSLAFDYKFNLTGLDPKTIKRKASDLKYYIDGLDELGINYEADEPRKIKRPTYAFAALLNKRVAEGTLAYESAKRIVSTIVEFYRWRIFKTRRPFQFPLWVELPKKRGFLDYVGREVFVKYVSTDLSDGIKRRTRKSDDDYIQDGGKLRPLPDDEIESLIKALCATENTEMKLSFLLAIETGGRMQSIFTLRKRHFPDDGEPVTSEQRVYIGPGTGADTKGDKIHYLDVPAWLYNDITKYLSSNRYKQRSEKLPTLDDDQYVFIASTGRPYYKAKDDEREFPTTTGETVRVFISNTLTEMLMKQDCSFKFSFHDLRATFGMGLVNAGLKMIDAGLLSRDGLLNAVREAMGHSDIRTTLRYLSYRETRANTRKANAAFETKLVRDINLRLQSGKNAN
jgi:integrase